MKGIQHHQIYTNFINASIYIYKNKNIKNIKYISYKAYIGCNNLNKKYFFPLLINLITITNTIFLNDVTGMQYKKIIQ